MQDDRCSVSVKHVGGKIVSRTHQWAFNPAGAISTNHDIWQIANMRPCGVEVAMLMRCRVQVPTSRSESGRLTLSRGMKVNAMFASYLPRNIGPQHECGTALYNFD